MTASLVLGLGNPLLGDDGVGPRAVAALADRALPPGTRVLDGGTGGLALLPEVEGAADLMIIDAVDLGPGTPAGSVWRWEPDRLPRARAARGLSAHHVGLSDLLSLCALRGTTPARVVLFGVQVERLSVGAGLSPAVEAALPGLLAAVRAELFGGGES